MSPSVAEIYGHKVRVRTCGLCWNGDKLLVVNHKMDDKPAFWTPPGGGLEFGELVETALKREFLEETGLEIESPQFAFSCEVLRSPLHAIELFFHVHWTGGNLKVGYDPELQIIQDVKFMTDSEISQIEPDQRHGIFQVAGGANHLKSLSGFYSI